MRKILAVLMGLVLSGCATIEYSQAGDHTMVVVSNSSWYFLNLIPIASGNPEKVNQVSTKLFCETATLENNLKILDHISEKYGVKTIKSLKSFWNDESVFIIFMKRHVIHTSAELVLDEAAKESKSDENNKSDSKS